MDYGIKTLPVTGGGLGLSLIMQSAIMAIVFIVTTILAATIHFYWRKNKTLGE